MKVTIRLAVLMSFGFLLGCSSSPPLFLGGNWVFTITPSNSAAAAFQATGVLTQLGNSLFGPVTLRPTSSTCNAPAMVSGTINGNQLSVQLSQSQSTLNLSGEVTGGPPVAYSVSGKYTATTGACLQDGGTGTWSGVTSGNNASTAAVLISQKR